MKDQHNNKTQDWLEVTMPLEVAQAALPVESVFDKTRKLTFEDQLNILLFACYATQLFTVKDIQEAVIDAHRATVYSQLQNFVEWRYLERVSGSHYKATQYAKDIMNVERELKA